MFDCGCKIYPLIQHSQCAVAAFNLANLAPETSPDLSVRQILCRYL
jgi:hypothetical protein